MVRAGELEMINEGMVDKVKDMAKKAEKAFWWSETDPKELRQYVRDASDETLKKLAGDVGENPSKGSPRDHQIKVIRNELLKRFGQIKAKEMLGEDVFEGASGPKPTGASYGGKNMSPRSLKQKLDSGELELLDGMTFADVKAMMKAGGKFSKGGKIQMIDVMDHNKGKKIKISLSESMHYHTDDNYDMSHVDAKSHRDPINVAAPYETTADAPEFEQEEEDHELANDTTKVTVPASILNDLKKVIDECRETAQVAKRRDDPDRMAYYDDTANAMQQVHDYLSMRTVEGMKRAQLLSQRMLNVSRRLMPNNVWKFIVDGGKKRTLKDYHNEVKNMPIVGPRNTLDDNR
jgi:hypothetical protein